MAFQNGPLTSIMSPQEGPRIQSSFMPQDALSAPTSVGQSNAEQLSRLSRKISPDEDDYQLNLIKQAKDRLLAQSTGVDPLISWLAAYGSADPRNKLGAAAQAMTQAVGQQDASKQKLDLDVLQLDLTASEKRGAIAAAAEKARLDRDAKLELKQMEIAAENKRLTEKLAEEARHDRDMIQARIDTAVIVAGNKPVPATTQRRIFDLSTAANTAEQDAKRFNQVATDFEDLKPTGGFFGNIKEASKKAFGAEDYQSYVRKEFQEIMRQGMLQNLPKGAASDADVRLVREAQLSDFANPALVPEVLRAMARIKQRNSDLLNFQSEYVSFNPLKTTLQEDQEIGGILIPKGSTFSGALKFFNEKNPYSSSLIKTPEAELEGDAAQGTGNSTKSSNKVDDTNPLLQ